jgi:ABC-type multidrug transport system ATPase subunit
MNNSYDAVVFQGLCKTFKSWPKIKVWDTLGSHMFCGCCCCCWEYKWFSKFVAVDELHFKIRNNSLLAMLGHNGAGKSTTINILTGNLTTSKGDARIFGYSVKRDMASIRAIMGVCPQHDVLWAQLTGREHLQLFAQLKGAAAAEANSDVAKRIADVLLQHAADRSVKTYSGGMKRRLSIAISLIGKPSMIFLDEPTTGMTPTRVHIE